MANILSIQDIEDNDLIHDNWKNVLKKYDYDADWLNYDPDNYVPLDYWDWWRVGSDYKDDAKQWKQNFQDQRTRDLALTAYHFRSVPDYYDKDQTYDLLKSQYNTIERMRQMSIDKTGNDPLYDIFGGQNSMSAYYQLWNQYYQRLNEAKKFAADNPGWNKTENSHKIYKELMNVRNNILQVENPNGLAAKVIRAAYKGILDMENAEELKLLQASGKAPTNAFEDGYVNSDIGRIATRINTMQSEVSPQELQTTINNYKNLDEDTQNRLNQSFYEALTNNPTTQTSAFNDFAKSYRPEGEFTTNTTAENIAGINKHFMEYVANVQYFGEPMAQQIMANDIQDEIADNQPWGYWSDLAYIPFNVVRRGLAQPIYELGTGAWNWAFNGEEGFGSGEFKPKEPDWTQESGSKIGNMVNQLQDQAQGMAIYQALGFVYGINKYLTDPDADLSTIIDNKIIRMGRNRQMTGSLYNDPNEAANVHQIWESVDSEYQWMSPERALSGLGQQGFMIGAMIVGWEFSLPLKGVGGLFQASARLAKIAKSAPKLAKGLNVIGRTFKDVGTTTGYLTAQEFESTIEALDTYDNVLKKARADIDKTINFDLDNKVQQQAKSSAELKAYCNYFGIDYSDIPDDMPEEQQRKFLRARLMENKDFREYVINSMGDTWKQNIDNAYEQAEVAARDAQWSTWKNNMTILAASDFPVWRFVNAPIGFNLGLGTRFLKTPIMKHSKWAREHWTGGSGVFIDSATKKAGMHTRTIGKDALNWFGAATIQAGQEYAQNVIQDINELAWRYQWDEYMSHRWDADAIGRQYNDWMDNNEAWWNSFHDTPFDPISQKDAAAEALITYISMGPSMIRMKHRNPFRRGDVVAEGKIGSFIPFEATGGLYGAFRGRKQENERRKQEVDRINARLADPDMQKSLEDVGRAWSIYQELLKTVDPNISNAGNVRPDSDKDDKVADTEKPAVVGKQIAHSFVALVAALTKYNGFMQERALRDMLETRASMTSEHKDAQEVIKSFRKQNPAASKNMSDEQVMAEVNKSAKYMLKTMDDVQSAQRDVDYDFDDRIYPQSVKEIMVHNRVMRKQAQEKLNILKDFWNHSRNAAQAHVDSKRSGLTTDEQSLVSRYSSESVLSQQIEKLENKLSELEADEKGLASEKAQEKAIKQAPWFKEIKSDEQKDRVLKSARLGVARARKKSIKDTKKQLAKKKKEKAKLEEVKKSHDSTVLTAADILNMDVRDMQEIMAHKDEYTEEQKEEIEKAEKAIEEQMKDDHAAMSAEAQKHGFVFDQYATGEENTALALTGEVSALTDDIKTFDENLKYAKRNPGYLATYDEAMKNKAYEEYYKKLLKKYQISQDNMPYEGFAATMDQMLSNEVGATDAMVAAVRNGNLLKDSKNFKRYMEERYGINDIIASVKASMTKELTKGRSRKEVKQIVKDMNENDSVEDWLRTLSRKAGVVFALTSQFDRAKKKVREAQLNKLISEMRQAVITQDVLGLKNNTKTRLLADWIEAAMRNNEKRDYDRYNGLQPITTKKHTSLRTIFASRNKNDKASNATKKKFQQPSAVQQQQVSVQNKTEQLKLHAPETQEEKEFAEKHMKNADKIGAGEFDGKDVLFYKDRSLNGVVLAVVEDQNGTIISNNGKKYSVIAMYKESDNNLLSSFSQNISEGFVMQSESRALKAGKPFDKSRVSIYQDVPSSVSTKNSFKSLIEKAKKKIDDIIDYVKFDNKGALKYGNAILFVKNSDDVNDVDVYESRLRTIVKTLKGKDSITIGELKQIISKYFYLDSLAFNSKKEVDDYEQLQDFLNACEEILNTDKNDPNYSEPLQITKIKDLFQKYINSDIKFQVVFTDQDSIKQAIEDDLLEVALDSLDNKVIESTIYITTQEVTAQPIPEPAAADPDTQGVAQGQQEQAEQPSLQDTDEQLSNDKETYIQPQKGTYVTPSRLASSSSIYSAYNRNSSDSLPLAYGNQVDRCVRLCWQMISYNQNKNDALNTLKDNRKEYDNLSDNQIEFIYDKVVKAKTLILQQYQGYSIDNIFYDDSPNQADHNKSTRYGNYVILRGKKDGRPVVRECLSWGSVDCAIVLKNGNDYKTVIIDTKTTSATNCNANVIGYATQLQAYRQMWSQRTYNGQKMSIAAVYAMPFYLTYNSTNMKVDKNNNDLVTNSLGAKAKITSIKAGDQIEIWEGKATKGVAQDVTNGALLIDTSIQRGPIDYDGLDSIFGQTESHIVAQSAAQSAAQQPAQPAAQQTAKPTAQSAAQQTTQPAAKPTKGVSKPRGVNIYRYVSDWSTAVNQVRMSIVDFMNKHKLERDKKYSPRKIHDIVRSVWSADANQIEEAFFYNTLVNKIFVLADKLGITVTFEEAGKDNALAFFETVTNNVHVFYNPNDSAYVEQDILHAIVHEMVHAISLATLDIQDTHKDRALEELKDCANEIQEVYNEINKLFDDNPVEFGLTDDEIAELDYEHKSDEEKKKILEEARQHKPYGLKENAKEFIAELFSNPAFEKALRVEEAKARAKRKKDQTLCQWIVRICKKLARRLSNDANSSVYERTYQILNRIIANEYRAICDTHSYVYQMTASNDVIKQNRYDWHLDFMQNVLNMEDWHLPAANTFAADHGQAFTISSLDKRYEIMLYNDYFFNNLVAYNNFRIDKDGTMHGGAHSLILSNGKIYKVIDIYSDKNNNERRITLQRLTADEMTHIFTEDVKFPTTKTITVNGEQVSSVRSGNIVLRNAVYTYDDFYVYFQKDADLCYDNLDYWTTDKKKKNLIRQRLSRKTYNDYVKTNQLDIINKFIKECL